MFPASPDDAGGLESGSPVLSACPNEAFPNEPPLEGTDLVAGAPGLNAAEAGGLEGDVEFFAVWPKVPVGSKALEGFPAGV